MYNKSAFREKRKTVACLHWTSDSRSWRQMMQTMLHLSMNTIAANSYLLSIKIFWGCTKRGSTEGTCVPLLIKYFPGSQGSLQRTGQICSLWEVPMMTCTATFWIKWSLWANLKSRAAWNTLFEKWPLLGQGIIGKGPVAWPGAVIKIPVCQNLLSGHPLTWRYPETPRFLIVDARIKGIPSRTGSQHLKPKSPNLAIEPPSYRDSVSTDCALTIPPQQF